MFASIHERRQDIRQMIIIIIAMIGLRLIELTATLDKFKLPEFAHLFAFKRRSNGG